jgi:hypothetical protein
MSAPGGKDSKASLAQSVERETLNLKVAGSTPAWGLVLSSFAARAERMCVFGCAVVPLAARACVLWLDCGVVREKCFVRFFLKQST